MKNKEAQIHHTDIQKIDSLFRFIRILSQQNEFQELIRIISKQASILFDPDIISITMINPQTQNTVRTIMKDEKENNDNDTKLIQTNVVGWVSRNKQSFLSKNIKNDDRFSENLFKNTSIQSVMCVPLHSESFCIGYIVLMNKCIKMEFDEKTLSLFEKFCFICSPFLSNVQKILEYFKSPLPEFALN